ncbi:MAG TPA: glycine cleavage system protein GcvH [Lentisphaeria bacterium]|nr:MAG: glycine cleavage system protein H [Lentisphaerae bacterium GWF2_38_69]HBM15242.1 glycine cleavage system protein GcvH [Lentisphaeria bacterium]
MKKFTKEHEWVLLEGTVATIGITAHAAHELGDITYVELPSSGAQINAGEVLTVIESVKAASDVYSPVSGIVEAANQELEGNPQLVNESPEEEGWVCKLKGVDASELDDLMDEKEYRDYVELL